VQRVAKAAGLDPRDVSGHACLLWQEAGAGSVRGG
jgi:hypothetical protein